MNKFNTNKYNTQNTNRREEFHARIKEISQIDNERRKREQLTLKLGAGATAAALLGSGMAMNLLPANTESTPEQNTETGVHNIDVSDYDLYESSIDGDTIAVNIEDDARLREEPRIPSHSEKPNLLHEVEGSTQITVDYEMSEQDSIPIAKHEGFNNPDWIGISVDMLPEELQEKVSQDKDGIVWVSSEKAALYTQNSETEEDPTPAR